MTDAEKIVRLNNKILREVFSKSINGSFLIGIKSRVLENPAEVYSYYQIEPNAKDFVCGTADAYPEYEICRMIVGCHLTNTIFLSDEDKRRLEKDECYKKSLVLEVKENIKLRGYAALHFRKQPIIRGEEFIFFKLPYLLFAVSLRINELLGSNKALQNELPTYVAYSRLSNKALAALALLENNMLDNAYPVCRTVIEIYSKFFLLKCFPQIQSTYIEFEQFELKQSCCEQAYPEEFNKLFEERIFKKDKSKVNYLHFGWVDKIPSYHKNAGTTPYSVEGIFAFLSNCEDFKKAKLTFENISYFRKMCNAYVHGSVSFTKYPLLHYFEITAMLYLTVSHAYRVLCEELGISTEINGVDIDTKLRLEGDRLMEQYRNRSTENFEDFYNKKN